MPEGEISLKAWIAFGETRKVVKFGSGEFDKGNHSTVQLFSTPGDRGVTVRTDTFIFPEILYPETSAVFDALSALQAGSGSFRFMDNSGKEIPCETEQPLLIQRTIRQLHVLERRPEIVEIRRYDSMRQYNLHFTIREGTYSCSCKVGIGSIVDRDGVHPSKDLPMPLLLVDELNY